MMMRTQLRYRTCNNQPFLIKTSIMVYWVSDMMALEDSKGTTLSYVVSGTPPVQERARMNHKNRDKPTIYDPTSGAKKRYGLAVKQAMVDIGLVNFPHLSGKEPVTLVAKFFLPRRKKDYKLQGKVFILTDQAQVYPECKDVDNLLKFVMDALGEIVYKNDNCVVTGVSKKRFPPTAQSNSEGWAEVEISVRKPVPVPVPVPVPKPT
jgi:Holliday junction resolvase RusA-like endonuclease